MTVASLSAIGGPKFVMFTSKSARTSPFMAKKSRTTSPSGSNLSTPEGLSGRGGRKLSASRFMESVLGGLGLGAKHQQFLTVPGEQQPPPCSAVDGPGPAVDGRTRQKSKSLAMLFHRNASDDSLSNKTAIADDKIELSKVGGEPAEVFRVEERVELPRVQITDTELEDRSQSAPNGSGRLRKSGIPFGSPQQSTILEELRQNNDIPDDGSAWRD